MPATVLCYAVLLPDGSMPAPSALSKNPFLANDRAGEAEPTPAPHVEGEAAAFDPAVLEEKLKGYLTGGDGLYFRNIGSFGPAAWKGHGRIVSIEIMRAEPSHLDELEKLDAEAASKLLGVTVAKVDAYMQPTWNR